MNAPRICEVCHSWFRPTAAKQTRCAACRKVKAR